MNADGTNLVTLTDDMPGNQMMPAWSPRLAGGEERIAFVHDPDATGGRMRIWSMRPDGGDRRQITHPAEAIDSEPAWSPDGATIAFQRIAWQVPGDIFLVNSGGGNERPLVGYPGFQHSPRWSPDGKLLAFRSSHETYGSGVTHHQIYTVWADGSKLARRTFDEGQKTDVAWLPRN